MIVSKVNDERILDAYLMIRHVYSSWRSPDDEHVQFEANAFSRGSSRAGRLGTAHSELF